MCRASVGWRFREDKAVRSSYSKTRIMPCYAMFNRPMRDVTSCVGAWSNYSHPMPLSFKEIDQCKCHWIMRLCGESADSCLCAF